MATQPDPNSTHRIWVPRIVGEAGANESWQSASSGGSGGGGGSAVTDIARLQERVQGAFTWLGLLSLAFAGAFIYLLTVIDNRFDRVDDPLRGVEKSLSEQTATLRDIDRRISELEKTDDPEPTGSETNRKAG